MSSSGVTRPNPIKGEAAALQPEAVRRGALTQDISGHPRPFSKNSLDDAHHQKDYIIRGKYHPYTRDPKSKNGNKEAELSAVSKKKSQ